jgi:hypothetical protein
MFKKPEFLIVSLSILITSLISLCVGVGGLLITGQFWGFFVLAFILQFIIFAIVNTILIRKDQTEGTRLLNQQLEVASKYTLRLSCAYCKIPNLIPVVLNQENRFKCESCNQINGVKMQFFATQITTPLKKITLPLEELEVN